MAKKLIAIYKNLELDYLTPKFKEDFDYLDKQTNYLKASNIVEVEFEMISDVDLDAAEVKAIDVKINELRDEFGDKIDQLNARKQELLSITYEVQDGQ